MIIKLSDGRTIEDHYQCDIKGFAPGESGWQRFKGKAPMIKMSRDCLYLKYKQLYLQWSIQNKDLMLELLTLAQSHKNMLSDRFATSDINQARALSEILNEEYL